MFATNTMSEYRYQTFEEEVQFSYRLQSISLFEVSRNIHAKVKLARSSNLLLSMYSASSFKANRLAIPSHVGTEVRFKKRLISLILRSRNRSRSRGYVTLRQETVPCQKGPLFE